MYCASSNRGKVALQYALSAAPDEPLPEDIWILDSLPGIYNRVSDQSDPTQSVVNVSRNSH